MFAPAPASALYSIRPCFEVAYIMPGSSTWFKIEKHFSKAHSVHGLLLGLSEFWKSAPQLGVSSIGAGLKTGGAVGPKNSTEHRFESIIHLFDSIQIFYI